jgi:hypothetical protein
VTSSLAFLATYAPLAIIQSDVFTPLFALFFGALVLALFEACWTLLVVIAIVVIVVVDIVLRFRNLEPLLGQIDAACITAAALITAVLLTVLEPEVITVKRTRATVRDSGSIRDHECKGTAQEHDELDYARNSHDIFL